MTAANRGGGYTEPARGLAGMVAFAGVMLALVGFFDILQGLTALFNDEYFVVARAICSSSTSRPGAWSR